MQRGSWRDPNIGADLWLLAAVVLLLLLAAGVQEGLRWALLVLVLLGAITAGFIRLRGGASEPPPEPGPLPLHPGPNVSRIPAAGLPGLVLAAGFVWMFWFGLPGMRPVVIGVAGVGCLLGLVLV